MHAMEPMVNVEQFDEEAIDPIMLSRLEAFIEKHLFFVNYVLFLTYLKYQMKISTQNLSIMGDEDLDNSEIFYDVFSAIKVFKAAL